MYGKLEPPITSAEKLLKRLNKLPAEIDKLDWLKFHNINLEILNEAFEKGARNGSLNLLKLLLKIDGINPTIKKNMPIRYAAEYGHVDVVEFLNTLDGVDPAACTNYAIGMAAANGHLAVVKFLCTLPGVAPDADNDFAIRHAMTNNHPDVGNYLASLPCYNPFLPNKTFERKKAIFALFRDLKLESHLQAHQITANHNLKFLFFSAHTAFNDPLLLKDIKQVIVQRAIDADNHGSTVKLNG